MPNTRAIWAIDLGQCALKALRCTPGDDPTTITVEAFDHIEYQKILNQPDADSAELLREAIELFLSRHSLRGDRVAIAVPGQSGLSRFIKLPPVEAKKIPDMVWFEARQNIPFPLEDVVWDYQPMGGGMEMDGLTLGVEVGLFAIKREQVARALRPFDEAGIEVDIVQLAPLTLYNYLVFDHLPDLPPAELMDEENPPPSVVVLSMGTEATDIVVTNGYRMWQRSVPVGGNHFTKAMTKELRLTFSNAEHLKRNASQSSDALAVFQALRPVFADLVTEVQRTIGYFTNIDRSARITGIVALGNGLKLLGLTRFLSQSIGLEVTRVESFRGLEGPGVVDAPDFRENASSFGVCYGLAVQALRDARVKTNLVPREIVKERMIRAKKPWAVAACALLLLALTCSFGGGYRAWIAVQPDVFGASMARSDEVRGEADAHLAAFHSAKEEFDKTADVAQNLVYNVEGRLLWVELMKAINLCLPGDGSEHDPDSPPLADISDEEELHVTQIECQRYADLSNWWKEQSVWYRDPTKPSEAPVRGKRVTGPGQRDEEPGPTGPGWVIQLHGHHFHNSEDRREDNGNDFVMRTLITGLHQPRIDGFPVGELGISHATVVNPPPIDWTYTIEAADEDEDSAANAGAAIAGGGGALPGGNGPPGVGARQKKRRTIPRPVFVFTVQFCWRETPPSQRPAAEEAVAAAPMP